MRIGRLRVWLTGALAVASCDGGLPVDLGPAAACSETPLRATLHLDAADARHLWATDDLSGAFIELRLRPDPPLGVREGPPTLLVAGAAVVGRDGDRLVSGCRELVSGAYQVGPGDIVAAP